MGKLLEEKLQFLSNHNVSKPHNPDLTSVFCNISQLPNSVKQKTLRHIKKNVFLFSDRKNDNMHLVPVMSLTKTEIVLYNYWKA